MEDFFMKLEELTPHGLDPEDFALGVAAFLIAAVFAFSAIDSIYDYTESIETSFEVNSSTSLEEVRFFNHSVNLMLEDSTDAVFYLDTNRDGSADEVIGRNSTRRVQRTVELVDFPDGVYRLYIQFQDGPEKKGDAWMKVYRVTKLG